ncbi:MAG TPA: hypothetical protein VFD33_08355, partial [Bacillota bacterium]|nr:hypothetical protein [Bacillota bacterium]
YYRDLDSELYAVVEPIADYVEDLPLIVAHTGIKHHSGNFHRPLRDRWIEGDQTVVKAYNDIAQLAREGKKAMLRGDWDHLSYLMNKNHEIQDNLTDSGPENNHMIKVAKKNGALAAKLAGAGGGGTIIVLSTDPDRTKEALTEAGAEDFIDLDAGGLGVVVEQGTDLCLKDGARAYK